jgi:hypothetical protein
MKLLGPCPNSGRMVYTKLDGRFTPTAAVQNDRNLRPADVGYVLSRDIRRSQISTQKSPHDDATIALQRRVPDLLAWLFTPSSIARLDRFQ